MGLIGETLVSRINNSEFDLAHENAKKIYGIGSGRHGVNDAKKLLENGYDPLHAGYIFTQNLISEFAECMSILPEMKAYCELVGPAEDEYMPSGPPMSPLTGSYFTCWAFFDARFGPDKETIGTCLLDIISRTGFLPGMGCAIELMQNSRMGIYEHLGFKGDNVILQELMTQEKHVCYVPAGYPGKKGQIWLVRVLPPMNESFDYGIVFNTPYVLIHETKDNWVGFLQRTLLGERLVVNSYQELMKYGLHSNYWNEYIFLSYVNNLSSAIFLRGLPDVQGSLPHSKLSRTLNVFEKGRKTLKTGKKKKRR